MKKSWLKIILSGFIITSLLAGCGGQNSAGGTSVNQSSGGNQSSNSEEKVVLNYYVWSDIEPVDAKIVDAFNEIDPNIQVALQSIPNDSYGDKMRVLLSGGSDVDIFAIRTSGETNHYTSIGALAEVTDFLGGSSLNLAKYGPLIDYISEDNRYYALPKTASGWYLFYNKEIFDREGLPYPTQMTWDEYAVLAKSLTKGEGNDKQWGGYWAPWIMNFMGIQTGEYLIDDNLEGTKAALELYDRLYNIDNSHMSIADMLATSSNFLPEFESGNVAMLPQGDWFIPMFEVDKAAGKTDVEWDMAPIPVFDGVEPGTTVGGFSTAAITSTCPNKEAAFKFLEFLCGERGAIINAENTTISAYNVDEATDTYVDAIGKDSTRIIFDAKIIQEQSAHPAYRQVNDAFREDAQLYLIGEYTIDQMMDEFIANRAEILAE